MKKVFLVMLVCFCFIFGLKQVAAWDVENTWDYLPLEINYLDPINHRFTDKGGYNYQFETINPFIIEENKQYSLYLTSPFEEITSYSFTFYDASLTTLQTPQYNEVKNEGRIKGICFSAPVNAKRIKINVNFKHFRDMPQEYGEDGIDSHFVFLKGWECPDRDKVNLMYKGPRDLNPVIEGEQGLYITNVNDPIAVEEIKSYLRAYDDTDGDVTDSIIVYEDNYTSNKHKLGLYSITFRATDSNNNSTDFIVNVQVIDTDGPLIDGTLEVFTKISTKTEITTILNGVVLSDNYDSSDVVTLDIVEDNYTPNYNKVGTYQIKIKATDSSGNTTNGSIIVNVEDDIKPVISGVGEHTKSNALNVDLSEFINQYTASDETDGDITSKIEIVSDDYTPNQYNAGIWDVVISVKDKAGNKTTKTIKIEVIDKIGPVFYVDRTKIVIDLSINSLNLNNIISTLQASNIIKEDLAIEVLEDNYSENYNKPGNYKVLLGYQNQELELEIEVLEKLPEIEEVEEVGFFKAILNFFKNIWKKIISFFKLLFYKG